MRFGQRQCRTNGTVALAQKPVRTVTSRLRDRRQPLRPMKNRGVRVRFGKPLNCSAVARIAQTRYELWRAEWGIHGAHRCAPGTSRSATMSMRPHEKSPVTRASLAFIPERLV